jgi:uncharacterized protein YacL
MAASTAQTGTLKQAPEASPKVGQQVIAFIEVLLLAVWLGAMMFFSFAVAPTAFAVLPSRELAGKVVTSAITKVEVIGLIVGAVLFVIQVFFWRARRVSAIEKAIRASLLILMITMAALSQYWISPKMSALRVAMGGLIDDVPATDPLRVQFNDLHQYSVALMGTAMLAGLVVLFITVRSLLKR